VRLHLDATPEELAGKAEALVRSLAAALAPAAPELAEQLEKAIPRDVPRLQHRTLRDLHERTREAYEIMIRDMVADIGKVLDQSVLSKAEDEEPKDPRDPDEQPLEPGDINPDTGEEVPEKKEPEPESEDEDDEDEGEEG